LPTICIKLVVFANAVFAVMDIMITSANETKERKMNSKQKKLNVTLNQWKEIYNKEMAYSADLRKVDKIQEAHLMILKIEKMIADS